MIKYYKICPRCKKKNYGDGSYSQLYCQYCGYLANIEHETIFQEYEDDTVVCSDSTKFFNDKKDEAGLNEAKIWKCRDCGRKYDYEIKECTFCKGIVLPEFVDNSDITDNSDNTIFGYRIDKHNFEESYSSIVTLRLDASIPELQGFTEKDWIFPHNITGEEINVFVKDVQENLKRINERTTKTIREIENVYKVFETLDRDYLNGIVLSIKAAEKAVKDAEKAQGDIDETIETLEMTVVTLNEFVSRIDSFEHLNDIDDMWKDIDSIKDYKRVVHRDINEIREQTNSTIKEYNDKQTKMISDNKLYIDEKTAVVQNLRRQNMILFCMTGVSIIISVVSVVLSVLGGV